jgi:hypothetical protein
VPDYSEELQRRIGQFSGYLKKMYHRAHEEVEGSCFIIFEERSPTNGSGDATLSEAAKPALEVVVAGFADAGITSVTMTDELSFLDLPNEGWKEDDSQADLSSSALRRTGSAWICRSRRCTGPRPNRYSALGRDSFICGIGPNSR